MKYDDEEIEILDALEQSMLELKKPSKSEIAAIKAAAANTPGWAGAHSNGPAIPTAWEQK